VIARATSVLETSEPLPVTTAQAFERLFMTEYRRVVAIAARVLGRIDAAEDVAQEVFAAFARRHDPTAPFASPWLHTAAAHAALNVIRGERRRRNREVNDARLREPLGSAPSLALEPERCALEAERRRDVRSVLGRLPRRHARLLALRYGGLSYVEIAAALGIKPSSVGTMLARAELAFERELGT